MNSVQQGILALIRSAITGTPAQLPTDFSLDQGEHLIVTHQVAGMAYEGGVVCGLSKKDPVMARLFQRYYQGMLRSNAQLQALAQVFQTFEAHHIAYLPVKGCNVKSLYPRPAMRSMGDADVLIRYEQYEAIRPLMQALGYEELPEYHHELPWDSKALHLELHRSLIPDFHTQEYRHFSDAWQKAVHTQGMRYNLSCEDHFEYLFVHYAKHYRSGGIGIRQPIDLWVWQRTYPQMDMEAVRGSLADLGMLEFFDNTQAMLQVWFDGAQPTDKTDFMTDFIFASGAWGQMENRQTSAGLLKARQTGSAAQARKRYLWEAIFPPLDFMKKRYPVLKKAPWLLPVLWPVRWVTALLFRHQNIRNYRSGLENASDAKIESFEQSLRYVGLDFHL